MKLLENILVFVAAVFKLFQKFRNCLRKSTKLKMMLWYSLSLSIHPPTRPPMLPQQNNLSMTCLPYESPIAQWLEHPTSIWKVVGLIPV